MSATHPKAKKTEQFNITLAGDSVAGFVAILQGNYPKDIFFKPNSGDKARDLLEIEVYRVVDNENVYTGYRIELKKDGTWSVQTTLKI